MKIGALFTKTKASASPKKIIVLALHIDGTNVEEKIISQRQTKKQKKIKKIYEQKVLSRSFDLCGGLSFLRFPQLSLLN